MLHSFQDRWVGPGEYFLGVNMVKGVSILILRVVTGLILVIVTMSAADRLKGVLVALEPYFAPYASMATMQQGLFVLQLVLAGAVVLGLARIVFLPIQVLAFAYAAGLTWVSTWDQMAFGVSLAELDMFLLPLTITLFFGASLVQLLDRGDDRYSADRLLFNRS